MLTVNSPLPLRNSFVPSSGSTSQNRVPVTSGERPLEASSSETTGMSGVRWRSAGNMMSSAAWSAAVTGLPSAFAMESVRP